MKDSRLTRREMILSSACAIGGLTLSTSCRPLSGILAGSSHRGFKIGACDWTLGKTADPGSFEVAKRIGLDGVQVSMGTVKDDMSLRKPEVQKAFLNAAKKQKVEVASLAIGELNNIPYKSDPRAEQWVCDSVDVCRAMDVKVVLLAFFGKGDLRNDRKGVDTVVEQLRRVAPKAEKSGVVFGLESLLSAEQHMDIINRVGSPSVQVYYDVGNSHREGYNIYREIRLLGKRICEFHAKDYDGLFGRGSINFREVRRAMDDVGYRGWIQIEPVEMPLGPEMSCRYNTEYLRGIFPPKV